MLPVLLAAALLLIAGVWWTLAVLAWTVWGRVHESPGARQARLQARKRGKGGLNLLDVVGFGIPVVIPIGLAIDGLFGSKWVFYSPNWSFFFPWADVVQAIGAVMLFIALPVFTSGAYLTGKYVFSKRAEERKLLRVGPYRFVRHPIYLGFGLLAAGYVLLALNYLAFPCLVLFMDWGWRKEDTELEKRYGAEYIEYRDRTGAFFPRIRKRS